MADLKNLLFGALLFVTLIAGMYASINGWYSKAGVAVSLDSGAFNVSGVNTYLNNWSNQTATSLSNAQAIPFFGGSFMLLTGVFQAITLIVGLPNAIILPLLTAISSTFGLPVWFVAFLTVALILFAMLAIINVMKGDRI